jgi:tetratricopeptide (TPR) repeat protein
MFQKKEYSKAVTMFEEALRIKVRVYGLCECLDLAVSLNNMGCARIALASPSKALSVYREAFRILKELMNRVDYLDPDLLRYQAMTLRNIGHCMFTLKRFDEAASYYQEACTVSPFL